MGNGKIKKEKETKFDVIIDWSQFALGIILALYGMFRNNSIAIGIGGLLVLFSRRKINISIPLKK